MTRNVAVVVVLQNRLQIISQILKSKETSQIQSHASCLSVVARLLYQGYNCQAAVDKDAQVIVGTNVTQATNDKQQVLPLVASIAGNTNWHLPKVISADSGYFSEDNCKKLAALEVDAYIATGRLKHGETPLAPRGPIPKDASIKERMSRKLRTVKGKSTYSLRKHIVEPVFGQIKEARNFRRFSFRGLEACQHEWDLVCLTHNLLKLFRAKVVANKV